MHFIYDWPQGTTMILGIQGQGHSALQRVILSTNFTIDSLFIMMLFGTKFIW